MFTTDICRVCEVKDNLQYNIYDVENSELLVMLRLLTNVQFDKNDLLPKYLCMNCAGRLPHAYAFKLQCETTDRQLRELLLESEKIDTKLTLDKDEGVKATDPFDCEFQEEYLEDFHESYPASSELEVKQEESDDYEEKYEIEDTVCKIFIAPDLNTNDKKFETEVSSDPLEKVQSSVASNEENIENNQNDSTMQNKNKPISRSKIHGKMQFKCNICPRYFYRKDNCIAHQLKHTDDPKNNPCHLCDRKYVSSANLNRHILIFHRKEKTHSCQTCGKTFGQKNTLKCHEAVHSKEQNFECDECGRKYKTHYQLTAHKKVHDPLLLEEIQNKRRKYHNSQKNLKKPEILSCPYCDYRTVNPNSLKTHIRTHTGEKPYECSTCGKRFHAHISWKTHLMIHSDERPFHCDICGGTYRQWAHLKNHQRKHSDELIIKKPFLCDICGKSFSQKPNLRIHRRIHTGERPFQCSVCGTGYADKAALKKHGLKHAEVDSI